MQFHTQRQAVITFTTLNCYNALAQVALQDGVSDYYRSYTSFYEGDRSCSFPDVVSFVVTEITVTGL